VGLLLPARPPGSAPARPTVGRQTPGIGTPCVVTGCGRQVLRSQPGDIAYRKRGALRVASLVAPGLRTRPQKQKASIGFR
jgi:hypothetical protein